MKLLTLRDSQYYIELSTESRSSQRPCKYAQYGVECAGKKGGNVEICYEECGPNPRHDGLVEGAIAHAARLGIPLRAVRRPDGPKLDMTDPRNRAKVERYLRGGPRPT